MYNLDLFLILFITIQPSIIGLLLFSFSKYILNSKYYLSQLKNSRKRYKGARFFECATYPRLIGKLKYDIQALAFVIVFIVYDVDLLFFLSEAIYSESWSIPHLLVFIIFLLFFILGLVYDITRQNFNWSY